jgi:hypothetical protein
MRGTGFMVELTSEEYEAAVARGKTRMHGPRAKSAHYDAGRNRVIVRLTTGVEIGFAPRDAQGLQSASAEDLNAIELEAFGLGIHFPRLDVDLYVPALLKGILGSKRWMAARAVTGEAGHAAAQSRRDGNPGRRRRKIISSRG